MSMVGKSSSSGNFRSKREKKALDFLDCQPPLQSYLFSAAVFIGKQII